MIERVIKSCPISYYTHTDKEIDVIFNDGEDVYINLLTNEITVGKGLFDKYENLTEDDCRAVFYHEISHAILTDKDVVCSENFSKQDIYNKGKELGLLFDDSFSLQTMELKQVLNIIEDERIESILANYYLDVDFYQNILNITKDMNEDNPFEKFFVAVRHRKGKYSKLARKLLQDLLKSTVTSKDYLPLVALYVMLKEEEKQNNEKENNSDQQNKEQGNKQQSQQETSDEELSEEETKQQPLSKKEQDNIVKENIKKIKGKQEEEREKELTKKSLENLLSLDTLIEKLALKAKTKTNRQTNEVRYSYTNNKIDYLRLSNLEENKYKFFTQKGKEKQGNKEIIINLYLDESGSFSNNENVVNEILRKLMKAEDKVPNFRFTLTTIQHNKERVLQGKERQLKCSGGTSISTKFEKTFKNNNYPHSYNIFLLDGETDIQSSKKSLDYLDTSNTYVCVDKSNTHLFKDFTKAKVDLVQDNYTQYIKTFIRRTLQKMIYSI